jgi:hypothetical protein
MFHYLYFISDILVVSYVLWCAAPAESDNNGACSAGAVAIRRQNGVSSTRCGRAGDALAVTCTIIGTPLHTGVL